jgi:predicted ester cyclase
LAWNLWVHKKGRECFAISIEENKAISRRSYEEIYHKRNIDIIDEFYDEKIIAHTSMGEIKGLEAGKQLASRLLNAFEGLRFTVEDQIAEGAKVVNRGMITGNHTGEYMGIAPTGKAIRVSYIGIHVIANGKILEGWGFVDNLSLLQQIGAISL